MIGVLPIFKEGIAKTERVPVPYTSTIEGAGGRRAIGVSEQTIDAMLSKVREELGEINYMLMYLFSRKLLSES